MVSFTFGRKAFFRFGLSIAILVSGQFAQSNVVGVDTQNFNPLTSGLDFVTVHSSETLEPGLVNFGYFLNFAANSFPESHYVTTRQKFSPKDSLLSGDFNIGVGLTENWDFGLSLPHVIQQDVEDNGVYIATFDQTGLTEVRLNTKYRLIGDRSQGLAGVFTVNFNQIQDNAYLGSGAGPTMTLEVVADTTVDDFALAGNFGYRKRNSGEPLPAFPIEPLRDQWIASVALSYLVTSLDTKLIAEVFGSVPAQKQEVATDRGLSSAEFLLGAKHDITPSVAVHAGGGLGLAGLASPDWRLYTGLNWTFGPLFSKPTQEIVRAPEPPAKVVDEDPFAGMPQAAEETFIAKDVLFKFNSDMITQESVPALAKLIAYLLKPPGFEKLYIDGHTDSVGTAVYNLDLSRRRAANVKKLIVETFSVPESKIVSRGYGESQPIADNGNFQGRSINRRVEFKIMRDKNAFIVSPNPSRQELKDEYPTKKQPSDSSSSIFRRKEKGEGMQIKTRKVKPPVKKKDR